MIIWGIYADLVVEKFKWHKIMRSYFIALFYALLLTEAVPYLNLFIVCLAVIGLERITTEIYKALFRVEPQKKYKIPSHLGLRWGRLTKIFVGTALLITIGLLWFMYLPNFLSHKLFLILFTGGFIALCGMLKDAPYEGFDKIKFWRSPVCALVAGLILWGLFPNLPIVPFVFAVAGFERIISECYKKILQKKIPGKFKDGIPHNNYWLKKRDWLLPIYIFNLILIAALVGI